VDIALRLECATPVALRARRNNEESATLPYIPGATLLGALAAAHQILRPGERDEFAAFFLAGHVSMGNAYPATFTQAALVRSNNLVAPLPLTAQSCKRYPGFLSQDDVDHPQHGVFDHLLPWLRFALSAETDHSGLEAQKDCARCAAPLAPIAGYYRRNARGAGFRSRAPLVLHTHVGIDRATGTAQEGILYSRQALDQGTVLQAHLRVAADAGAPAGGLQQFIADVNKEDLWRVGGGRTRGLGLLRHLHSATLTSPYGTAADIRQRLDDFNRRLRAAAPAAAQAHYVPLTLRSDLLLPDHLPRWRTCLDGEALADHGLPGAQLAYHVAHVSRVRGWNAVQGLPRLDALAIAQGSVFVLAFAAPPDIAALERLQRDGMGVRRDGGYGRITVADPFHHGATDPYRRGGDGEGEGQGKGQGGGQDR